MCREMSVSDTEISEVTWTENGTFNLSEGHTPQTENSEGKFSEAFQFLTSSQTELFLDCLFTLFNTHSNTPTCCCICIKYIALYSSIAY